MSALHSTKHLSGHPSRRLRRDETVVIVADIKDGMSIARKHGVARSTVYRALVTGCASPAGATNEVRVCELVTGFPELAEIMDVLLPARTKLRDKFNKLLKKMLGLTSRDGICRMLMIVGSVVSLAFVSTINVAQRFKNSKSVEPILGLTPKLNEPDEIKRIGRISSCGDAMMRSLLYEAALTLLTLVKKWS